MWRGIQVHYELLARAFYYIHRDVAITAHNSTIVHLDLYNEQFDEEMRTEQRSVAIAIVRDRVRSGPLSPQIARNFAPPPLTDQVFLNSLALENRPMAMEDVEA